MLKTIVVALSLLTSAHALAATPSYAGKWRLDKAGSTDLPQRYHESIEAWTLDVTQDDKQVTVAVEIDAKDNLPDLKNSFTYPLDGSEAHSEIPMIANGETLKVPTVISGRVLENGRLELSSTRELSMGDRKMRMSMTEQWSLAEDGALLVRRTEENRMGTSTYTMRFVPRP